LKLKKPNREGPEHEGREVMREEPRVDEREWTLWEVQAEASDLAKLFERRFLVDRKLGDPNGHDLAAFLLRFQRHAKHLHQLCEKKSS
jgi:hypothetical protein